MGKPGTLGRNTLRHIKTLISADREIPPFLG
jgi:hypothetical protein